MPEKYKKKGIGTGFDLPQGNLSKKINQVDFWFTLSFILLIGVLLFCFGLWGYQINLNKNNEGLTQKLEELQSKRNLELEGNFIELKEIIENFKEILDKRLYSSNILKTLEELTLPQVQYSIFRVDLNNFLLDLKAKAINYSLLAEQIMIFENDSRIKKIGLSEISLEKSGSVGTDLNIELDPNFLYE